MASSDVGDRILWATILASAVAAYWYIPSFLHHVRELAVDEGHEPEAAKPQLVQNAEAAIQPSTIAQLASGPSHPLTSAAIRLAARRLVKDARAKKALLADLSSTAWNRRDRAVKGLHLLVTSPALRDSGVRSAFTNKNTYKAIVTALVNLLPEHIHNKTVDTSPVKPVARPAHESSLLNVLAALSEGPGLHNSDYRSYSPSIHTAIEAGLITKWLQHYPFPCSLPRNRHYNFKKHDVVQLLDQEEDDTDDYEMTKIIRLLLAVREGEYQLTKAGLKPYASHAHSHLDGRDLALRSQPTSSWTLNEHFTDDEDDFHDQESETGALISDEEMMRRLSASRQRAHPTLTPGELSRHRRHRQAIVVAEAGIPLGPDSILQRRPTRTELTWAQEAQERNMSLPNSRNLSTASMDGTWTPMASEDLFPDEPAGLSERFDVHHEDLLADEQGQQATNR